MRVFALLAFVATSLSIGRAADWPLFGHDPARGATAGDPLLRPITVGRLRVRWRVMLGGVADASPIVVGRRLFITRRDGTTLAIDTSSGRTLWRFATRGPKITSSVPAYDVSTRTLYAPGVDGAIHKLDPANGRERRGSGFPAPITVARDTEKDASSLNIANGYLYAQTAGYVGDARPYVGHVVAVRLRDGQTHVFNSLCSTRHGLIEPQSCAGQRSGMWSRAGVVVDPERELHGRIYVATGNGPYDVAAGNYGDSILALDAGATRLLGTLTPGNYAMLEATDRDVGSSSPALLPRQRASGTPLLAVQAGKDSTLRLFDRTRMDGHRAPLQTIALASELFSAPAVWTDNDGTTRIFLGLPDGLHAYRMATPNRTSRLLPAWRSPLGAGNEGTSPVVVNGILFFAASGELTALDARSGRRLWSSTALGPIHWESPAVAGGVVYCADGNGALSAFALDAH